MRTYAVPDKFRKDHIFALTEESKDGLFLRQFVWAGLYQGQGVKKILLLFAVIGSARIPSAHSHVSSDFNTMLTRDA